jgi:hypothetical protein
MNRASGYMQAKGEKEIQKIKTNSKSIGQQAQYMPFTRHMVYNECGIYYLIKQHFLATVIITCLFKRSIYTRFLQAKCIMSIPITVNVETLTEEELQARFEDALEKVRGPSQRISTAERRSKFIVVFSSKESFTRRWDLRV